MKGSEIATPLICYAIGHLSFEMSCSFRYQAQPQLYFFPKELDEMLTWCQKIFMMALEVH